MSTPTEHPALDAAETADEAVPTPRESALDSDADETADDIEPGDGSDGRELDSELEQEGEIAADYLEELLDIADLDGDLDIDGDRLGDLVVVASDGGQRVDLRLLGALELDLVREVVLAVARGHAGQLVSPAEDDGLNKVLQIVALLDELPGKLVQYRSVS